MTNALDISKWFLANNPSVAYPSRPGNIKLQKLLYYSKAMYFSVYGQPLFEETFEAWENGPVVRSTYIEYRHNGLADNFKSSDCPEIEVNAERVLKIVNFIYGHQTSNSLIDLTHKELPWKELETEVEQRMNPIISDERIKTYYESLVDIFNLVDDEEIENTVFANLNGNIFSYDKRNTALDSNDKEELYAYGEHAKDNNYAVYKDDNNELVVY